MPTYEYSCKSCGEHLEVVQSFKDDALTECPHCGGELKKVFGSIGIVFKGSGFYKTDSRPGLSALKTAVTPAAGDAPAAAAASSSSESSGSGGASTSSGDGSSGTSTPAASPSAAPAGAPGKSAAAAS